MMYKIIKHLKKNLFPFILIFIILCNFTTIKVKAKPKEKVLIVYDKNHYFSYTDNLAKSIKELLGAFNSEGYLLNIKEYKPSNINNYNHVFILGLNGDFNNKIFIKDLKTYKGNIFWIGKGIKYFIQNTNKYPLKYMGIKNDITEIYYSNKRNENLTLSKMEKFFIQSNQNFSILKPLNKEVKILSYISNGKNYYPYAIKSKNLFHISRLNDDSILFYIFSDLLNDQLNFKRDNQGKVFIRIEDVHPFRDLNQLKKIADYLYSENVPFMIALIPTFVDTKTGYINKLSQKKDFAKTIKYMQERGGTVLLHGYTHQNTIEEASGEGFEFWDGQQDKPLNKDMPKYVYNKIYLGLKECVKNGIYPLGFEAPHYAMDSNGYKEIKKYFSTYIGQYQSNNEKFTTTTFPYTLYNTENFNKLIPENLGYVEKENPLSIKEIQENFRQVSMIRGYTAGVFFHCYLNINYLKELVTFFKSQEIEFLDLKEEENSVKCNDINIQSKNGEIKVTYKKENSDKLKTSKKISYISNINLVLIIIITFFCFIFLIIFIISKKRDKNKFLR